MKLFSDNAVCGLMCAFVFCCSCPSVDLTSSTCIRLNEAIFHFRVCTRIWHLSATCVSHAMQATQLIPFMMLLCCCFVLFTSTRPLTNIHMLLALSVPECMLHEPSLVRPTFLNIVSCAATLVTSTGTGFVPADVFYLVSHL